MSQNKKEKKKCHGVFGTAMRATTAAGARVIVDCKRIGS